MGMLVNEKNVVDEQALAAALADRAEKLLPAVLAKFATDLGAEVRYLLTNSEISITITPTVKPEG